MTRIFTLLVSRYQHWYSEAQDNKKTGRTNCHSLITLSQYYEP